MAINNILQRFQVLVDREDAREVYVDGLVNLPCFESVAFSNISWPIYRDNFANYLLSELNKGRNSTASDIFFDPLNIVAAVDSVVGNTTIRDLIDESRQYSYPEILPLLASLSNKVKVLIITILCEKEFECDPTSEYEMIASDNYLDAELNITIRSCLNTYSPQQLDYCLKVIAAAEKGQNPYLVPRMRFA